ncbi:MAG: cadherin repeat domain-containing protein [Puniceicoccaceae bacterium]
MKNKSTIANILRTVAVPVLLMLATVASVEADTLTYEGFDITPGELDNTIGETSWGWGKIIGIYDKTWWAWDQVNNDFFHAISDGGLEYPGLPSKGNAFEFTLETPNADYNKVYRELNKFYSYASTGQLWFSAIVKPKIDGDPTGYGWFQVCLSSFHNAVYFGVSNSDDQTVWSGGGERMYIRTDENPDGIQGAKWAYSEVPIEDGVEAFLVMHLDFDNKLAHFYVNPPVDTEDPGEPVADFVMLTDLYVDKVMMWINNNGPSIEGPGADYIGTQVDEIRLGDTYASVAAGADLTDPGGGEVDVDPPVITGPTGEPGAATSSVSIPENVVKAATMEADETVTWSISGGADADFFTIGSGTGGLSFKVFADFETPLDADGNNEYVVTVQAMDEAGNTSTQDVLVSVTDIVDEIPPVVTGLSGAPGDPETSASVNENTVLVGTYTADKTVTWDLSGGMDRSFFQIGAETGELSFLAAPDFEDPVDDGADNIYEVEVRARDESLNAGIQLVFVTVLDVNEDGDLTPPVITGFSGSAGDAASSASIDENTTDVGSLTADEEVTWLISGGADSAAFELDISSGALAFLSAPDFEEPGDADMNNDYVVEVEATDTSGNASTHTVTVTVLDVEEIVTWGFWTPDDLGWIDTNADGGLFMGWVNVHQQPWVWVIAMNKYIYMPDGFISDSGSWSYTPATLDNPVPGEWGYWSKAELDWVDTTDGFLGWVNVFDDPWIFSQSMGNYLYLSQDALTSSGAWLYVLLNKP